VQLAELPTARTRLLDNLGRIRREVGPVTPELSDALADHMRIRRGEVAEVVSFYSFLRLPLDSLRVCTGPVCACLGGHELLALAQELAPDGVPVVEVACLGHCEHAPVGTRGDTILPGLSRAVLEGAAPAPVTYPTNDGPSLGLTRPEAPASPPRLPPERVLSELEASGLVGLGGAGFPTWRKWEAVRREPGPRVVIVNADEGEPGTIKDRYIMELRPNLMLEGLLVAMEFAEAEQGYIYLREEYATARARLLDAIAALGDLGGRTIELVVGAGSYICGEETAMLESMEGRRGMPRLRPPFPAQRGYLGAPTLIDNVETLAHIPGILRNGGAWFAALGRRGEQGTRLWSLSGAVAKPGCYEAGNGITLRELIDEHGGGATDEIGAIVPGGAASGILPPAALDAALTKEALAEWGASVGSAAVQVFPVSYSPLELLTETMKFFAEESCQKCTPCRIGTRGLHHLAAGRTTFSGEELEAWLEALEQASICGLGQGAPIPVRSVRRHWPGLLP
jgi:formate dehydrogenase beta subunit